MLYMWGYNAYGQVGFGATGGNEIGGEIEGEVERDPFGLEKIVGETYPVPGKVGTVEGFPLNTL